MKTMIVMLLCLCCCTDEDNSKRTLEDSGYTNIHIGGYSAFMCGEDDTFHTAFTATNPAGKVVSGTVCCGMLLKGCTIRF